MNYKKIIQNLEQTLSIADFSIDEVFNMIEKRFGISQRAIKSNLRTYDVTLARSIFAKIMRIKKMTFTEIGKLINRHYSSVIQMIKKFNYEVDYRQKYIKILLDLISDFDVKNIERLEIQSLFNVVSELQKEIKKYNRLDEIKYNKIKKLTLKTLQNYRYGDNIYGDAFKEIAQILFPELKNQTWNSPEFRKTLYKIITNENK